MGTRRAAVAVVALLSATPAGSAPVCERPPDSAEHYAMVASGGISLGSYQAGVSYVLLRWLRDKKEDVCLDAATGASAGNINAFLAALTWFQKEPPTAGDNLFWDAWVNVDWRQLSPDTRDCEEYQARFADPAWNVLGKERVQLYERKGEKCPPLFSKEDDSLVTRRAFGAVIGELQQRLNPEKPTGRSYRARTDLQRSIDLGVTLNLADINNPEKGSRVVAPMKLSVADNGSVEFTNLDQGACNVPLGKWLQLGERKGLIPPDNVIDTVEASSAFPIAFAPKALKGSTLLSPPDDPANEANAAPKWCNEGGPFKVEPPKDLLFSDGGLFDNIPLGLAMDLLARRGEVDLKKHTTYLYVWPDLRRGSIPPGQQPYDGRRGLGFLGKVVGHYVEESRGYEIQGLSRYRREELGADDGRLLIVDRFFPVVGNFLIAFGAFMKPEYRIHDYLVGLYDGVFAVTRYRLRQEHPEAPCAPGQSTECDTRFREEFERTLHDLVVKDDGVIGLPGGKRFTVAPFLKRLLDYELSWTSNYYRPASTPQTEPCCSDERIVWNVFETLRDLDEEVRHLATRGSPAERRAQADRAGDFAYFLGSLKPEGRPPGADVHLITEWIPSWQLVHDGSTADRRPERYGLEAYTDATIHRLLQRAIEIEHEDNVFLDAAAKSKAPREPRLSPETFLVARLVEAWALERDPVHWDVNASSAPRLMPDGALPTTLKYTLAYLLPGSISTSLAQRRVDLDWDARVRFPSSGFFLGGRLGLAVDPLVAGARPAWGDKLGVTVGFDPRGRLLDDLQLGMIWRWSGGPLGLVSTAPVGLAPTDAVGIELSIVLGTKVRLGLEWTDLLAREGTWGLPRQPVDTLLNPRILIGLTDLSGLAVAIVDSMIVLGRGAP